MKYFFLMLAGVALIASAVDTFHEMYNNIQCEGTYDWDNSRCYVGEIPQGLD